MDLQKHRGQKARFYADENISLNTVYFLRKNKINIKHCVEDFNFGGRDDLFHFNQTKIENRILLPLDSDFLNNYKFKFSQTLGIVFLIVPPPVTSEKVNKLISQNMLMFKKDQEFFRNKKFRLTF